MDRQWQKIKKRAKTNGIKLVGDLPFYVSRDSVDVWSNRSLFSVSSNGDLIFQSGVPPDYFSDSGQLNIKEQNLIGGKNDLQGNLN